MHNVYPPFSSPLAAYCWVPGVFLDFPPPGVGPRTLLDFVAAGASFVVEALRKLATYIHEHSSRYIGHHKMEWTRCRAHDALGQIAAALDLSDGENKVVVMPKERRADFRVGCPKAVRASVSWRPGHRDVEAHPYEGAPGPCHELCFDGAGVGTSQATLARVHPQLAKPP